MPSNQPQTSPMDAPGSMLGFVDLVKNVRIPILLNLTKTLFDETRDHIIISEFTATMREAYAKRCLAMVSTRGLAPGEFRLLRWYTPEGDEKVPPIHSVADLHKAESRKGGIIARACEGHHPKLASGFSVAHDPGVGELAKPYQSLIAVALPEKSQPADWLVLLDFEPAAFTERDLEDLLIRANLVGLVLRNINVATRLKDATAYIQNEIDQIAEIQRNLLPQKFPEIADLDLAASYATFDRAGGDYYDVFPDPAGGGNWGFLIADASGHGPSAAVVVAMLHAVIANLAKLPDPAEMLEEINRRLFARRIGNSFVTALAGNYEPATHTLRIAGAGHPPPLVRTGTTVTEIPLDGGPPLGILDRVDSQQSQVVLNPGDCVLLYTDGISEGLSADHKLFGFDRIRAAFTSAPASPQGVIDSINASLKIHIGAAKPSDDQTMLVIRRIPL